MVESPAANKSALPIPAVELVSWILASRVTPFSSCFIHLSQYGGGVYHASSPCAPHQAVLTISAPECLNIVALSLLIVFSCLPVISLMWHISVDVCAACIQCRQDRLHPEIGDAQPLRFPEVPRVFSNTHSWFTIAPRNGCTLPKRKLYINHIYGIPQDTHVYILETIASGITLEVERRRPADKAADKSKRARRHVVDAQWLHAASERADAEYVWVALPWMPRWRWRRSLSILNPVHVAQPLAMIQTLPRQSTYSEHAALVSASSLTTDAEAVPTPIATHAASLEPDAPVRTAATLDVSAGAAVARGRPGSARRRAPARRRSGRRGPWPAGAAGAGVRDRGMRR